MKKFFAIFTPIVILCGAATAVTVYLLKKKRTLAQLIDEEWNKKPLLFKGGNNVQVCWNR